MVGCLVAWLLACLVGCLVGCLVQSLEFRAEGSRSRVWDKNKLAFTMSSGARIWTQYFPVFARNGA